MIFEILYIDHVQLAAPPGCEMEARRFFGTLRGMTEIAKPEELQGRGGVWFQCGSTQLHIGVQKDFTPATKAHPVFLDKNLSAFRIRMDESQIPVTDDAPLNGCVRRFVSDPFGNRLEFVERIHANAAGT